MESHQLVNWSSGQLLYPLVGAVGGSQLVMDMMAGLLDIVLFIDNENTFFVHDLCFNKWDMSL